MRHHSYTDNETRERRPRLTQLPGDLQVRLDRLINARGFKGTGEVLGIGVISIERLRHGGQGTPELIARVAAALGGAP